MPTIKTCLWFDDQAERASDRYQVIFPDTELLEVSRYGPNAPLPEGTVLTIGLRIGANQFTLLNGGPMFHFTEAISFQIMCADQAEVDYFWGELTKGGEPGQCGWLKDEFGISWQVIPTRMMELLSDPQSGHKAMQAMLGMQKLELSVLEAAARQED